MQSYRHSVGAAPQLNMVPISRLINVHSYSDQLFQQKIKPSTKAPTNFIFDEHIGYFRSLVLSGLLPIIKDRNGIIRYELLSAKSIACISLIVFGVFSSYFLISVVVNSFKTHDFDLDEGLLYGCFMAYPFIMLVPIFAYLERNKFCKYMNEWQQFHDRFENVTKTKFPKTSTKLWIVAEFMGVLTSTVFIAAYIEQYLIILKDYELNTHIHKIFLLFFWYCTLIYASMAYLWFLFARIIKISAEAIVSNVESLEWTIYRSLHDHIKLWQNLRQLTMDLGQVTCITFLYVCLGLYLFAMPTMYVGIMSIQNGKISNIFMSLQTISVITCIAEIIHRAAYKVGIEFESRITKILVSGKAEGNEEELQKFLDKISANPVTVNIAGYMTMDRGINAPLYSSVVTYFIILVQFGTAEEKH